MNDAAATANNDPLIATNEPTATEEGVEPKDNTSALRINVLVVALILAGIMAQNLFYTVEPEERAVIKRFGAVTGQAGPGLHFKLPFGIDTVDKVATERVLKQEFGFRIGTGEEGHQDEREMLTGDLNMIEVSWVVQYQIQDPLKYLYRMREPDRTLRDVSETVVRRIVGNLQASDVLTTGRAEISTMARDEIQLTMNAYDSGIRVGAMELQAVVPPQQVRASFNEVNEARQERERMINEAIKHKNQEIPQAMGEASRTIAEAEAYAVERTNRAEGDVARFQAILKEYVRAPDVTRKRLYLETIREVAPKAGKIIVVQKDNRPQSFFHLNEQGAGNQK